MSPIGPLDSIPIKREDKDGTSSPIVLGLRDRALVALRVDSFARIGAVLNTMKVEDDDQNGKRGWLRLHEKGGKFHEVSAHPSASAEADLDAQIPAAAIAHETSR